MKRDLAVKITCPRCEEETLTVYLTPYIPATYYDPPEGGTVEDFQATCACWPKSGPEPTDAEWTAFNEAAWAEAEAQEGF
jgi:hypothetical protein